MKIVGITGNSGTGKTEISKMISEKYNGYLIDADKIARDFSEKNEEYKKSLMKSFGIEIFNQNGELIRKKLADIIYNDDKKKEELNKLTCNYIVKEIKNEIENHQKESFIILDAPLLFECDLANLCDIIIGIIAKKDIKIDRICTRDKISKDVAIKRLKIQKDNDFFIKNSDIIIENNYNSKEVLEERINQLKL